jgi:hypothetical protein
MVKGTRDVQVTLALLLQTTLQSPVDLKPSLRQNQEYTRHRRKVHGSLPLAVIMSVRTVLQSRQFERRRTVFCTNK